jgi:hypothetical protein
LAVDGGEQHCRLLLGEAIPGVVISDRWSACHRLVLPPLLPFFVICELVNPAFSYVLKSDERGSARCVSSK